MAVQDQDAVPQPPAVPDPPEQPDQPPRLPRLIYPVMERMDARAQHHLDGLAARFCGSGDDGWIFLAFQAPHEPGYALYNLDSRQRVPLPRTFMYPLDNTEYPLVVHAAAFSRPSTTDAVPLVVGAIAAVEGRPTAAFWTSGEGGLDTWVTLVGEALAEVPQDLIYIEDQRAFCFLMPDEVLVMYGPATDPDGGDALVLRRWDVDIGRRVSLLADVDSMKPNRGVIRRYLLEEDDGRLLMVLRWPATASFRILELIPYTTEEGEERMAWMDAYELVDPDDEDGHLDDTMDVDVTGEEAVDDVDPPWADLPSDILVDIHALLSCRADSIHMAGVSVHWRAAATRPRPPGLPPRPAQLPWMIFPGANPPAMYSVISGNFHHLYGLPADVRGARCCGSGDGGWLLLAFQAPHAPGYALYNLNSRQRVPLPATLMYPLDNTEYPLVVHVAAFSRPSTADAVPLVVGAIAAVEGRPTAAFWWGGLDTWTTIMAGEALAELPQDLIYIEAQDIFVFLTPREQLMNFMVVDGPDGNLVERLWDLHLQFRPDFLLGDVERTRRYILESRGQLLMAVRNVFNKSVGTTSIWLSELTTANDNGEPVWADNFVLDGRVLFLGPGCSRCFELASYNRVWDLAGDDATIYFLDETAGADTGRFSQRELKVEPWPPAPGPPRSDVPPTWWLHDA